MKIIGLQNAVVDGISGGNIRFVEVMKRLKDIEKVIITSEIGKKFDAGRKLHARFICTSNEKNIKITYTNVIRLYLKRIIKLLFLRTSFIRDENNIFYASSDFPPDVIPIWLWKINNKNIKWVQIIHHRYPSPVYRKGNIFINSLCYIAQRISFFLIRKNADILLVYCSFEGQKIKRYFLEKGFDSHNIYSIQNGIDYKFIKKITKNIKKRYDACYVGRLTENKGIFDLVSIWRIVCDKHPNAKLMIIGFGSDKVENSFKEKIITYNLGKNIILKGFLEGAKLYKEIKRCNILVHPSYEEGWGIAICEGMACGLPVIAWNISSFDIFTGAIILAPKGNTYIFAKKLLQLMDDKELYRKKVEDSKKIVRSFIWDNIAKYENKILKSLV